MTLIALKNRLDKGNIKFNYIESTNTITIELDDYSPPSIKDFKRWMTLRKITLISETYNKNSGLTYLSYLKY